MVKKIKDIERPRLRLSNSSPIHSGHSGRLLEPQWVSPFSLLQKSQILVAKKYTKIAESCSIHVKNPLSLCQILSFVASWPAKSSMLCLEIHFIWFSSILDITSTWHHCHFCCSFYVKVCGLHDGEKSQFLRLAAVPVALWWLRQSPLSFTTALTVDDFLWRFGFHKNHIYH